MGGHRSAGEVVGHLRASGQRLARASAFSGLERLAASGVVMRADYGPGAARYEVAESWHHHFVCRSCAIVMDVACLVGERLCLDPEPPAAVRVDEAQVTFRGYCQDCAAPGS